MLDGRRSRYDDGEYSYRYGFNLDDDGFNRDDPRNRSAYLYVKSPRQFRPISLNPEATESSNPR